MSKIPLSNVAILQRIIDAILDGSLDNAEYEELPVFGLNIPKAVNNVNTDLLNPRNLWADPNAWDKAANSLAKLFINNFTSFTDNEEGARLVNAGPKVLKSTI